MATLESVAVHLSPDRMTVGYYTVENGELKMWVKGLNGEPEVAATCILKPTDNAKAIAGVLTKEIRSRTHKTFWENPMGSSPGPEPIRFPEIIVV